MVTNDVVETFRTNGFSVWGGRWNDPVDWQHFHTLRSLAKILAIITPQDAETFFNHYTEQPHMMNKVRNTNLQFINLYKKDPEKFMKVFVNTPKLHKMEPVEALKLIN